ncbi:uncharacterized protein FTOL_04114 [Fusarium torulosum]|uniref:Uncharacterized protein n=1 Tax=Fusarium torulosum TaxID=33205 RepID=A0AAE8SFU4_9HYPO|nr:uncharacterized protein FTOL_04114 [Fusarium torulosum]
MSRIWAQAQTIRVERIYDKQTIVTLKTLLGHSAIHPSICRPSLPNPSDQLHQSSSWIFLQYSPLHVSGACSEAIDTAVVLRPQDGIGPED